MKSLAEFIEREAGHILILLVVFLLLVAIWFALQQPFIERMIDLTLGALLYAMTGKKKE